ncbi:MAG: hypothetical protein JRN45_11000 [Nitrososphaerota archaeon]|nr:hypothetical protein [Nitrososphaerota archaeon]
MNLESLSTETSASYQLAGGSGSIQAAVPAGEMEADGTESDQGAPCACQLLSSIVREYDVVC